MLFQGKVQGKNKVIGRLEPAATIEEMMAFITNKSRHSPATYPSPVLTAADIDGATNVWASLHVYTAIGEKRLSTSCSICIFDMHPMHDPCLPPDTCSICALSTELHGAMRKGNPGRVARLLGLLLLDARFASCGSEGAGRHATPAAEPWLAAGNDRILLAACLYVFLCILAMVVRPRAFAPCLFGS